MWLSEPCFWDDCEGNRLVKLVLSFVACGGYGYGCFGRMVEMKAGSSLSSGRIACTCYSYKLLFDCDVTICPA
jgi:hypothetical protein